MRCDHQEDKDKDLYTYKDRDRDQDIKVVDKTNLSTVAKQLTKEVLHKIATLLSTSGVFMQGVDVRRQ